MRIRQRIFGTAAETRGFRSALRRRFAETQTRDGRGWLANSRGGVGIYLAPEEVRFLPAVLGQLLPPDMTTGEAAAPLADPSNVKIALDAWGAVLVRLEAAPRQRRHPDMINAPPGMAETDSAEKVGERRQRERNALTGTNGCEAFVVAPSGV